MTQDTRKDRRAKIVSLNVRYKSATVDEFIDNHSHDVSKGGLFIKTSSPFPPGTLLKFEIRIAGDKAVIAGVGRVVWKRETSQAGPEVPAGMGVKFIKIDDASRAVIDKLVESRGESKNAYDEGAGDAAPDPGPAHPAPPTPAPPPAVVVKPSVPVGVSGLASKTGKPPTVAPVARAAPASEARPQPAPFRPAPSAAKLPAAMGKSTMMGIGGIQDAIATAAKAATAGPGPAAGRPAADDPRSKGPPAPRRPGAGPVSSRPASTVPSTSPMFPKSNSEADMPPKNEQTVMKQAAELLEEALRGAGGSMDEIGQNPLFDVAKAETSPATAPDKPASALSPAPSPATGKGGLVVPTPAGLGPVSTPAPAVEPSATPTPVTEVALPLRHGELEATARSATHDEAPLAAKDRPPVVKPKPTSDRVGSAAASLQEEEPKSKWLVPVLAIAAAGVLGFLFYTQVYAPGQADVPPVPTPPASVASAAASTAPPASASASAPVASAEPSTSATPEASSDASASATAALDASAAAPEAAAAAAVVKPAAPVAPWRPPPPKPKPPAPPPADTGDQPATPPPSTPTSATTTPPTPAPLPPADTATTAPTAVATPPAPKPPAKPAGKKDDDNPY